MNFIKKVWKPALMVLGLVCLAIAAGGYSMIGMPGKSYTGPLPERTAEGEALEEELEGHVQVLAESIGPRNVMRPEELQRTAEYLEDAFQQAGYGEVARQSFEVNGVECHNLEVEIPGSERADEIVVIGAHYDSAYDAPGANDNGSGVAGVLALAKRFADAQPSRTLRFVLFVNEEPPFFQTEDMGSLRYARRSAERGEDIVAMISLETIGYFDPTEGSQQYPVGLLGLAYPTEGDFVAFVANRRSRGLVRDAIGTFRKHAAIGSEGAALPEMIPGVGWSDHWAFWQESYPAIMVTDTAPFRYPYYHTPEDTPDKLDYRRMALVVEGLQKVIDDLI